MCGIAGLVDFRHNSCSEHMGKQWGIANDEF